MKLDKQKTSLQISLLISLIALFVALVSQHVFGMRPCAWCVLQRFILLVIALLSGAALLLGHQSLFKRVAALLAAGAACAGIVAAWYQYTVAALSFSCTQTFADKFMTQSGLESLLPWLFGIYATCSDARVELLGLEYAIWGLITFGICAVLLLFAVFARSKA